MRLMCVKNSRLGLLLCMCVSKTLNRPYKIKVKKIITNANEMWKLFFNKMVEFIYIYIA